MDTPCREWKFIGDRWIFDSPFIRRLVTLKVYTQDGGGYTMATLFSLSELIKQVRESITETMKETREGPGHELIFPVLGIEIEASVVITDKQQANSNAGVSIPQVLTLGVGASKEYSSQEVHKVKITLGPPIKKQGHDQETGKALYPTISQGGFVHQGGSVEHFPESVVPELKPISGLEEPCFSSEIEQEE